MPEPLGCVRAAMALERVDHHVPGAAGGLVAAVAPTVAHRPELLGDAVARPGSTATVAPGPPARRFVATLVKQADVVPAFVTAGVFGKGRGDEILRRRPRFFGLDRIDDRISAILVA